MRFLHPVARFGVVIASLLFTASYSSAQSMPMSVSPLSGALKADGSLVSGIEGTFDPRGYRFTTGPNGEPRFVNASQQTVGGCTPDAWDSTFSINGADQSVSAVVADSAGNIYVGGSFSAINTVAASRIAKWNGTSWSALGSGVSGGNILAIAVSGTDVYVAGGFTSAGGVPANKVAKWDGNSWSALGGGVGGLGQTIYAIGAFGNNVYVGGNFGGAGVPNRIAQWNGSNWSDMGTGMDDEVLAIAVGSDGSVYAGGRFGTAGGVPVGRIAKWNGTSWSAVGTGFTNRVLAIAVSGTDVYAGGVLGGASNYISRWNGSTWESLGSGLSGGTPQVSAIAVSGTNVYVGGTFTMAGGSTANRIARWDGAQWNQMGTGVGENILHSVNGIAVLGNAVLVGGSYPVAGGSLARNIAVFNSGAWSPFNGTGVDAPANVVAISGTDVYVGGNFTVAGPLTVNRIAKWNGSTWSQLGSGFTGSNDSVSAITVAGNRVYVGGRFSNAGGVSANNIAVWNGTNWAPLGSGTNEAVTIIVVRGEDVIIGGNFTGAGGIAANRLARWNGTSWSAFSGNPVPNTVTGIAFSGSDMFVSSTSTTVENPNYLLKYDGTTWTGLAPGMGGHGITSMAVLGTDVYISGGFQAVGGVSAARVAKWNGSNWSALGGGLPTTTGSASVSLGMSGNDLIAAGDFTLAAGAPANFIARWNGSTWTTLGNGINGPASRVRSAGGDIFAAGGFTTAGCNLSAFLARWRENVWTGAAGNDWHNAANWGSGSVPPANSGITIGSNNVTISAADVTVSSLIVANGRDLLIGSGRTLTVTGDLDLSSGTLTGPGSLVVNGDLILNGNVSGLAAINVNGNLYLNGGKISGTGPISITACRAGAISGGSAASFIESPLTRCVDPSGTYRFPVGTGTVYSPVHLSNIVGSANFTVDPRSGPYSGSANGLPAERLQRWWNLTNGGITQADLVFHYSNADIVGTESRYRAYRIEGGSATQLPSSVDAATDRVTTPGVTSFSPWTLAEGQPVPRMLNGRVTNPNGRGASGILVSLTDGQGNTRYGVTNPFGYYRFQDVLTYRLYTVRVTSKKFTFAVPERQVEFDEYTASVNFVSSDNLQ